MLSYLLLLPHQSSSFSSSIQKHLTHLLPIPKQLLQASIRQIESNLQDEVRIHCRPWRVRRWCCRTGNLPFWVPFLWCKLTPAFAAHVPVSRGDFLDIMARGVEVQWLCSRDGYLLVPRRLCLLSIDCAFSRRVAQCFNCFATLFNTSPSLQKLPSSFLLVQWRSSIERRLLLVSTRH